MTNEVDELADKVFEAMKCYMDARLAKHADAMTAVTEAAERQLETFERRLSRHSDHLNNLAGKVKKLEQQ